ncbi:MAG: tyrosine-type recombinase/integrase [Rhizobiaceae bacterium]|nr:tyrosine-type recombinase/integrase [Rhizobiaceae bacterium]
MRPALGALGHDSYPTEVPMSRTELLVVDALDDTLIRSVPLPQAPAVKLSAAAIKARLAEWERKYAEAQAPATLKAVRADWGVFTTWCTNTEVWGLPIEPKHLVQFLNDQVVLGKKRSTINRYVATLKLIHKAAGMPDPTDYPDWGLDWKKIVRVLAERGANAPTQATALKSGDVAKILSHMGNSLWDLRDAALIALASDTLCRESELVVARVEDLEPSGDDWALALHRSKTDQEGLGSQRFCSTETKSRIDTWCRAAGIRRGYLFPAIGRKKRESLGVPNEKHLAAAEVANIVRKRAKNAGFSEDLGFSGHSTRVGSAVELIDAGASLTEVRFAGGWQSERMVLQYGKKSLAGQGAMAQLRRKQRDA